MGWAARCSTASWRTPACSTAWQDYDARGGESRGARSRGHHSLVQTERYVQLSGGHHDWVKRLLGAFIMTNEYPSWTDRPSCCPACTITPTRGK